MTIYAEANWIKARARELGFAAVGFATVEPMDAAPLCDWLAAGYGAEMEYLQRHLPLRADLQRVLPGARSVICVALSYSGPTDGESSIGAIARYARGADYHDVVREQLQQLWAELQQRYPTASGRVFVDSGPLPERELARRAGLGRVGRHGCLLHPELGSRFVLGEILTTLALPASVPLQGDCGTCHACQHACPTGALQPTGVVDARRCLSYLTIEHKGPIPRELRPLLGTRLFGCDSCQDACPENHRVGEIPTLLPPSTELLAPDLCAILRLTPQAFNARFRHTPIQRTKRRGLLRNACVALGNLRDASAIPVLRNALGDTEALIRGHAAWALGQLGDCNALHQAEGLETDARVRSEIAEAYRGREVLPASE